MVPAPEIVPVPAPVPENPKLRTEKILASVSDFRARRGARPQARFGRGTGAILGAGTGGIFAGKGIFYVATLGIIFAGSDQGAAGEGLPLR